MNKVEAMKSVKDGLEVLQDIPEYAAAGWESIPVEERDRLKWAGVFFRRQTPGRFMMRVRMTNGFSNSDQFRALADISDGYGKSFGDLTTRQQMQLREFGIDDVPVIWELLRKVGLVSLQTGMDNIRTVVGCPVAGLTPSELLDGSRVAHEFTEMFVGNSDYTNLPRKFNVAITGCLDNCIHTSNQDVALTPAVRDVDGSEVAGFNVAAGGKMGSGGYTSNTPLDLFVTREEAAEICGHIALGFRDHGSREARNKTRLAFLIAEWGAARFRAEIEARAGRTLLRAGKEAVNPGDTDHVGMFPQNVPGLNYVGLNVPVGRITSDQMRQVARLADTYGNGDIRITTGQNLIIPNVPDAILASLEAEPLLATFSHRPSGVMRGTISCTGIDYCHFSLIETKERAVETAQALEQRGIRPEKLSLFWSGCANGCANHALADIGLVGKRVRVEGEILEAVDVYQRSKSVAAGAPPAPVMTSVLCSELPSILEQMLTGEDGDIC